MSADPTNTFTITENDLEPAIGGTIYRAATAAELLAAPTVTRYPLDCTNASTIHLILKALTGSAVRRLTSAWVVKANGTWIHTWVTGETVATFNGTWKGRVEIGWPSSRPQTAPSELVDAFTVVQQPDDG